MTRLAPGGTPPLQPPRRGASSANSGSAADSRPPPAPQRRGLRNGTGVTGRGGAVERSSCLRASVLAAAARGVNDAVCEACRPRLGALVPRRGRPDRPVGGRRSWIGRVGGVGGVGGVLRRQIRWRGFLGLFPPKFRRLNVSGGGGAGPPGRSRSFWW